MANKIYYLHGAAKLKMAEPYKRAISETLIRYQAIVDSLPPPITGVPDHLKTSKEKATFYSARYTDQHLKLLKIQNFLKIIQANNEAWSRYLQSLGPDSREGEEAVYTAFVDSTGFVDKLLEGSEICIELEVRVAACKDLHKSFAQDSEASTQSSPSLEDQRLSPNESGFQESQFPIFMPTPGPVTLAPVQPPPQPQRDEPNDYLRLPKIDLPKFSGDQTEFRSFWSLFETSVHSHRKLRESQKFAYLKGVLTGEAASVIAGIDPTPENYKEVIELLKQRYGDNRFIKQTLYSQLDQIPNAHEGTQSLITTHDSLEKVLRQLKAINEDINQSSLVRQVMQKFPENVILKLEQARRSNDDWTMQEFRDALWQEISAQRRAQTVFAHSSKKVEKEKASTQKFVKNETKFRNDVNMFNSANRQVSSNKSDRCCYFCEGDHSASKCEKFKTLPERKTRLTALKKCWFCCQPRHYNQPCKIQYPCYYCGNQKHLSYMCPVQFNVSGPSPKANPAKNKQQGRTATGQHVAVEGRINSDSCDLHNNDQDCKQDTGAGCAVGGVFTKSLLLTADVVISNPKNPSQSAKIKAFLDSGSERTFVSTKLANQLKLNENYSEILSVSTFGTDKPKEISSSNVTLKLALRDGSFKEIVANTVTKLTGKLHKSALKQDDLKFLEQYPTAYLADTPPKNDEVVMPDLLIGLSYFLKLVQTDNATELPSGLQLVPSKLGLLIGGSYLIEEEDANISKSAHAELCHSTVMNVMVTNMNVFMKPDTPLKRIPNVLDYWSLETLGITDSPTPDADEKAVQIFKDRIQKIDGRYHLAWLWNSEKPDLPDNYQLSMNRLKGLFHRLESDEKLLENYDAVIQNQLNSKTISIVDDPAKVNGVLHYIPHFPVITPGKSTAVRIVYDASAKASKEAKSFNDNLLKGPILLPDLAGLLMKFQTHKIGLISDIRKAFLQLALHEDQKDCTRFLWVKNIKQRPLLTEDNLMVMRFNAVIFGAKPSPSMLNMTIDFHLSQYKTTLADEIRSSIYVDNVVSGASTIMDAEKFYKESKQYFQEASMDLTQWASNSEELMKSIPEADYGKWKEPSKDTKVLGIKWNLKSDTISIPDIKHEKFDSVRTKRGVAEAIATIFDPLGYCSPVTLQGKLFSQKLWKRKLDWDDPLPMDCLTEWNQIATDLKNIQNFKIPRFVGIDLSQPDLIVKLICFVDGSKDAYSANVYIKIEKPAEELSVVRLLLSKSRLAPLCGMTIPRMETMGMLIGTRMLKFCKEQIPHKIHTQILFCDSQCTLHWLKSTNKLPVFVENRLREIRANGEITFMFIPSEMNPADISTRPRKWEEFSNNLEFWIHGPPFLKEEQEKWPKFNMEALTPSMLDSWEQTARIPSPLCEISANNSHTFTIQQKTKLHSLFAGTELDFIKTNRFSSLTKLTRVTVYCFRFLKAKIWTKLSPEKQQKYTILKKWFDKMEPPSNEITAIEMQKAKLFWEWSTQQKHFDKLLESQKKEFKFNEMNLFLDDDGIIRLKGRLQNAPLAFDTIFPKLLPENDHFTGLLIWNAHSKVNHLGVPSTLAELRKEYWIQHGKNTVKKFLNNCIVCKKWKGGKFQLPKMPPFPGKRVTRACPFQHVGLDYFGPITIKMCGEHSKVWVCLLTCLVTRAVHLEIVSDMSAEKFLLCLRRFISRRGRPETIICDNAKQFRLTAKTLDEAWKTWQGILTDSEIKKFLAIQQIKFIFIPEHAPWMGGAYERLISIVKAVLKPALGRKIVPFEMLMTYIGEAEAILNSRPISEIQNGELIPVIRPIDFLLPGGFIQTENLEEDHEDLEYIPTLDSTGKAIKFWKSTQKFIDEYWKLFQKFYLNSLQERYKSTHKHGKPSVEKSPEIGEIVIIQEDNLPRGYWKLGKIFELIQSSDKLIRSAKVQLSDGKIITRPVNSLYPLEIRSETTQNSKVAESKNNLEIKNEFRRTTRSMTKKKEQTFLVTVMGSKFVVNI